MTSNKQIGNAVERIVEDDLASKDYWVHNLKQSQAGQPADMIAVSFFNIFLIDAKSCYGNRFPLRRIEYNQRKAMKKFISNTMGKGLIAVYYAQKERLYYIPFDSMMKAEKDGLKSVTEEWLQENEVKV